jgi:hypothetical protein
MGLSVSTLVPLYWNDWNWKNMEMDWTGGCEPCIKQPNKQPRRLLRLRLPLQMPSVDPADDMLTTSVKTFWPIHSGYKIHGMENA